MDRYFTVLISLLLSACAFASSPIDITAEQAKQAVRNEQLNAKLSGRWDLFDTVPVDLIVTFVTKTKLTRDGSRHAERAEETRLSVDGVWRRNPTIIVIHTYESLPMAQIRVTNRRSLLRLLRDKQVASVQAEEAVQLEAVTMDGAALITNQPVAISRGYTGVGVGVAVLDTGAGLTSKSYLAGKVKLGGDYSGTTTDGLDTSGHGTAMNDLVNKMAPGATIWSYKTGTGGRVGTVPAAISSIGISRAVDAILVSAKLRNIRVANMSFSTTTRYVGDCPNVDWLSTATENLWDNGVLPVAAAGNVGFNISESSSIVERASGLATPACSPFAVTVGASITDTTAAKYSVNSTTAYAIDYTRWLSQYWPTIYNYGPTSWRSGISSWGPQLDLYAPGDAINGFWNPSTNTYTLNYRGTSIAAPLVAGALALGFHKNPQMTVLQAQTYMKQMTNRAVYTPGWSSKSRPLLNVDMFLAKVPVGTPLTSPPKTTCKINCTPSPCDSLNPVCTK